MVAELIRKAVEDNAHAAQSQDDYDARYNALVRRYEAAKGKIDEAQTELRQRQLRRARAAAFFAEVEQREGLLGEFDEELWNCTVESVTILEQGGFRVRFKDGCEVAAG